MMIKKNIGTFLAVQWLRLHASTAGGVGLILGGKLRTHMLCSTAKKKEEEYKWKENVRFGTEDWNFLCMEPGASCSSTSSTSVTCVLEMRKAGSLTHSAGLWGII